MEILKSIAMRKSTRAYKPDQISDQELDIILKAACAAPVARGLYEDTHLTVVQNAELLDDISKATAILMGNPNSNPLYGVPTLIIVSGRKNEKMPPNIELANASCMVVNMLLAATELSLGSVYIMSAMAAISKDESLLKKLNLPEGFYPLASAAVGYPLEPLSEARELKMDKVSINKIV